MGTADVVPGVSGSTMAYILGIYEQLLHALTRVNKEWMGKVLSLKISEALRDIPFVFLLPLALGIVLALALFTQIIPIPYLLKTHPEPVYGLFFGLIMGSIIMICVQHFRPRALDVFLLIAGTLAGYLMVTLIPTDTPDDGWFLFICGAVAICAMLLPGVSGSFILLVMGKYALILGALGELDFAIILPFVAGCAFGLLSFSHLLYWLIKRYHDISIMAIAGLMLGSIYVIWPFQNRVFVEVRGKERLIETTPIWPTSPALALEVALIALIGVVFVLFLYRLQRQKEMQH